jgi:predicted enzyme related to lactoylglutathione lyase
MSITKAYAVVCTKDLGRAKDWYSNLFGRQPDLTPMAEVHEWYFGEGGIQLLDDAEQSGRSKLTLIVDDMDAIRRELEERGLRLGEASSGDFATVAQITDPDGNIVTFAEPGPSATEMNKGLL